MSRKDYFLMAEALSSTQPEITEPAFEQWSMDVIAILHAFQNDNPNFKPNTFYAACSRKEET